MSFQLDIEDYPETRAGLLAEQKRRKAQREAEAAEDRLERRRETRPTYRKIDVSQDTQTLDIEEFPVQPTTAPPPEILRDIGRGIGRGERFLEGIPISLRATASELRFTEIELQGTGQRVKFPRKGRPSKARTMDIAADIQTLDLETHPARPVGIETPQSIRNITGLSLRAGAGFYNALTTPLRPTLIAETVKTGAGVIFSQEIRGQIVKQIRRDPAGFGAELGGGLIGGHLLGKGIGKLKGAYARRKYALDTPDEAFFHPEELAAQFPEEFTLQKSVFRGYKEVEIDATANVKFGIIDESAKWGDTGGFELYKPPKGTYRNRPWTQGGRSVLWTPEGRTQFKPLTHILSEPSFRAGLRITDVSPTISQPFAGIGPTALGGITALTQARPPKITPKLEQEMIPTVITSPGITNPITLTLLGRRQRQRPEQLPGYTQRPITITGERGALDQPTYPGQYQPQPHRQRQRQRLIPIQGQIMKQALTQRISIPPPPTLIMKRPTKRKDRYLLLAEKKKKKRTDAYAARFTGEFRRYGIDIKKLRRLI